MVCGKEEHRYRLIDFGGQSSSKLTERKHKRLPEKCFFLFPKWVKSGFLRNVKYYKDQSNQLMINYGILKICIEATKGILC